MRNNAWNYGGVLNQDGELLIGAASGNPTASFLTSSAGTLTFVFSPGGINIDVNFNSSFLNPLAVVNGGTGQVVLTSFGVLVGEGSNSIDVTAAGTDGQVLIAGTGMDPAFSTLTSSGNTLTFFFDNNAIDIEANFLLLTFFNPLQVRSGGTADVVLTLYGVLLGEGSNSLNVATSGTNPNGRILIASSTGDPKFSRLTTRSPNMLTFTFGYNSLNIDANVLGNTFFNPLQVVFGGTGKTILTTYGVLIGEGSNRVNVTAAGTNGQVLIAASAADPRFSRITSTGGSLTFTVGYNSLNIDTTFYTHSFFNPLRTRNGGTGRTVLTTFGVLVGAGSNQIRVTAPGTNGQLLIASSTGDPKFSTVTSTGNSLTFTFDVNALNIEPTFALSSAVNPLIVGRGSTGRTILTTYGVLIGAGSNSARVTAAGTNGQVLIAGSTGDPAFSTITSTGGSITFAVGYNSLNMDLSYGTNIFFNPLLVRRGGTGQTILTTFGVLVGEGSNSIHAIAPGTNGQVLIGSSTGDPAFMTITSTGGSITFTFGYNTLNMNVSFSSALFFNPLPEPNGGTGLTILTTYGVILGEGSNNVNVTAPGTNGQMLIASSTGDPQFYTVTSAGGTLTFTLFTRGYNSLNIDTTPLAGIPYPISAFQGATGRTILTSYGVLIGEGSEQVNIVAGTNGQVLIASSTGDPLFMMITSTSGEVTFTGGYNSLNIEADFGNGPLSPINGGTGNTILTVYGVLIGEDTDPLHATSGTNGQILIASSTGDPLFMTLTSSSGSFIFVFGYNSMNMEFVTSAVVDPVEGGGTGLTILTTYGVLIGEGSNNVNVTAAGTNGQVLIASSTGDPAFATITSSGGSMTFQFGYNSLNIEYVPLTQVITVPNQGTGRTILTTYGVLVGAGTNDSLYVTDPGTNGQLLIGSSIGAPAFATVTSTGGTFSFTMGYNSLNLEIDALSVVRPVSGGGTGVTILTTYGVLIGEGSNDVYVTDPGADGQLLIASSTGDPQFATITSTGGSFAFSFGVNSLNIDVNPPLNTKLGGTGNTILTSYGVLIGEGSLGVDVTDPGTNGQLLIAGSGVDPMFMNITSTGGTVTFRSGYNSLNIEVNPLSLMHPVSGGGTGRTIFTRFGVLIGQGSNNVKATAAGTNGQVLIASSTGDPRFLRITSTGGSITFQFGYNSLNIEILFRTKVNGVAGGGTGRTILTRFGVLIGEGSNNVNVTAAGTSGQVLIASSTGDPKFVRITSTGGSLTFSVGRGSLNIEVNGALDPSFGGTKRAVLTTFGVLVGEGSNAVNVTAPGTNGQLLIASSTGDPKFFTLTSTGGSISFNFGYNSLNINSVLSSQITPISAGGTGRSVLTTFGVLIGEGSRPVNVTAAGTNGQVLIASSTGDPKFVRITSTGNSLTFVFDYNSLNVDLISPIDISLGGTKQSVLTTFGVILGEGSRAVNVTAAGTNGQVLIAGSTGDPKFSTITSSGGSIAFRFGYNSLNMEIVPGAYLHFVQFGGTGRTILTTYGVLIGEGSNNVNVTAAGTNGQVLVAATNADPKFFTITSTGNTVTFTFGSRSLNIDTTIKYTYLNPWPVVNGGTQRTILTTFGVLIGEGSRSVNVTAAGTNGQVLIAASAGDPAFSTITSSGGSLALTSGVSSLNVDINGPFNVNFGGTGETILTRFGVLIGEGSNNVNVTAAGTNGQVLIASSTGDPRFATITSTGGGLTFTFGYNSLNIEFGLTLLPISKGGTGNTSLTAFGVLIGEGANPVNVTDPGTDGQLLIADTGADPAFSTITSSGGTIISTTGGNSLNLELNQYIPPQNLWFVINSVTGVTSSAVTASVSTSFNYYRVDTTNGTVTLQFPASAFTGRSWIVKDHGGMSDLNPIRITTSGGTLTFDGQTFFNLTNPFAAVRIMYNENAPAHYEII